MPLYCPVTMTTIAEFITSPAAAQQLGISHANLLKLLSRYPHLRPVNRIGLDYLWTTQDIERVAMHRARKRRRRRPETA